MRPGSPSASDVLRSGMVWTAIVTVASRRSWIPASALMHLARVAEGLDLRRSGVCRDPAQLQRLPLRVDAREAAGLLEEPVSRDFVERPVPRPSASRLPHDVTEPSSTTKAPMTRAHPDPSAVVEQRGLHAWSPPFGHAAKCVDPVRRHRWSARPRHRSDRSRLSGQAACGGAGDQHHVARITEQHGLCLRT